MCRSPIGVGGTLAPTTALQAARCRDRPPHMAAGEISALAPRRLAVHLRFSITSPTGTLFPAVL